MDAATGSATNRRRDRFRHAQALHLGCGDGALLSRSVSMVWLRAAAWEWSHAGSRGQRRAAPSGRKDCARQRGVTPARLFFLRRGGHEHVAQLVLADDLAWRICKEAARLVCPEGVAVVDHTRYRTRSTEMSEQRRSRSCGDSSPGLVSDSNCFTCPAARSRASRARDLLSLLLSLARRRFAQRPSRPSPSDTKGTRA